MIVERITTIKSGSDYRVKASAENGALSGSARFVLWEGGTHVVIITKSANLGAFKIERFSGKLSPASIREFVATTWGRDA